MAGKPPNRDVTEFAEALEAWAAAEPDPEKREKKMLLLRWLLSRCESRGFVSRDSRHAKEENKFVVQRRSIDEIDIKKAVMRAMKGYNPDLPTTSWVRGGPFWPRGYGEFWPKG